jgi:hypothetical protein
MKKYSLTSERFTGEIHFTFDADGCLQIYDNQADLNLEQRSWLLKWLPITEWQLLELCEKYTYFKALEIPFKVTFEMFWDRYNDKVRSSKAKTKKAWDKHDETNQTKAYLFYPKYNKNRGQAEKKYATTYLADELWNN